MNPSREQWALRVLSGEERGVRASLLRGLLAVAEPIYAGAMVTRNALYDAGILRSHDLPRPTISVGNLTTGGTGKTPVVRLLAEQFIAQNLRPAILMRGYRAERTGGSDEQQMLEKLLGDSAIVIANPDRLAGAAQAMRRSPPPDLFILDDGFQHRRVRRDFDLVLIDATNPFGHDHVLPRGLLREPRRGLARADTVVVTHLPAIERVDNLWSQIRRLNAKAPIVSAEHVHAALLGADDDDELPIDALGRTRFFAFAGIANTEALRRQFAARGPTFTGFRALPDHHDYSPADLRELEAVARAAGAAMLVTTEKDWVKIERLDRSNLTLPICRLKLAIRLPTEAADRLTELILDRLKARSPGAARTEASEPPAAKAS